MAEKILITGATGFLGKILSKELTGMGYDLYTVGRQSGNNLQVDLSGGQIELPHIDDVSMVVHAAGKAHSVPRTKEEEKEFFDVNFEGTKNLCNALIAAKIKPQAFIFISTVAVYGLDAGEFIKEDHPLLGETPYAKSKIQAEEWLQNWANDNAIKLAILRLPLVAGPNPPGNLGAMIKGLRSGKYFSIGSANAKKSVVWAADIAKILPAVAAEGGIFNLTDGYDPSFGELETGLASVLNAKKVKKLPYFAAKLLALIGDMAGKRAPINSNRLKKITSTLTFDAGRAIKILHWQPTIVINKLSEMI
jgi:nucleoside-diphosphate-sugar epimerase